VLKGPPRFEKARAFGARSIRSPLGSHQNDIRLLTKKQGSSEDA